MTLTFRFAVLILALAASEAFGAGDAQRGARLFGQCTACHSTIPGEHLTGPSLAEVWNRKAGTGRGFGRYSDVIKNANVMWNEPC